MQPLSTPVVKKSRQSVTLSQARSPHQRPTSQAPTNYRYLAASRDGRGAGNINESYDQDELDSTDFDDLIFALKSNGNFTPSIHDDFADSLGRVDDDGDVTQEDDEEEESFPDPPPLEDRYVSNVRRIRMGDTPL